MGSCRTRAESQPGFHDPGDKGPKAAQSGPSSEFTGPQARVGADE